MQIKRDETLLVSTLCKNNIDILKNMKSDHDLAQLYVMMFLLGLFSTKKVIIGNTHRPKRNCFKTMYFGQKHIHTKT